MSFIDKLRSRSENVAHPQTTSATETATTTEPIERPVAVAPDNQIELHPESTEGTFFNKKRITIIAALTGGLIFLGITFALTTQKKTTFSDTKKEKLQSSELSRDVAGPSSYTDLQNKPKGQQQATTTTQQPQKPIPNRPVVSNNNSTNRNNAISPEQKDFEAALKSNIHFGISNASAAAVPPAPPNNGQGTQLQLPASPPPNDFNGQNNKMAFVEKDRNTSFYSKGHLQAPISPHEIKAGTIIPGVLISGINSDLPGKIIAQVRENVFDSVTGNTLLIPQGSKLIGVYDSGVTHGQERVLVVWTRLILPNGESISLESMQGSDVSGYSGFHDRVDNHSGRISTGILVSGLLAAAADMLDNRDSGATIINVGNSAAYGAGEAAMRIGEKLVDKALEIQPTLKIRPGYRFNIMVTKDFILHPYGG